jgi:hypothetical protein
MAKKPTNATSSTNATNSTRAQATGTGRYVFCPGSGIAHEQVFLEILRGPKVRFIRCPLPTCHVKAFLVGPAWTGPNIGLSRGDARDANPNASIF